MKFTGYVLIAIGAALFLFAVVFNLSLGAGSVEDGGPVNATLPDRHIAAYWYALVPAALSAVAGVWLVLTGHKGYRVTYDMTRQQS